MYDNVQTLDFPVFCGFCNVFVIYQNAAFSTDILRYTSSVSKALAIDPSKSVSVMYLISFNFFISVFLSRYYSFDF